MTFKDAAFVVWFVLFVALMVGLIAQISREDDRNAKVEAEAQAEADAMRDWMGVDPHADTVIFRRLKRPALEGELLPPGAPVDLYVDEEPEDPGVTFDGVLFDPLPPGMVDDREPAAFREVRAAFLGPRDSTPLTALTHYALTGQAPALALEGAS